jgi:hypothetical protein
VIVDFRANPALLKQPGETRLCFSAQNAEVAVIDGGGNQPSSASGGCVSRQIAVSTKFQLTVSRKGAQPQRREVTVQVIPPSPATGDPSKGGGVVLKDGPVLKAPLPDAAKLNDVPARKVIPREAAKIPRGWCCSSGKVANAAESGCAKPGQLFDDKAEAERACRPQVPR